jgi:hypothetical protein
MKLYTICFLHKSGFPLFVHHFSDEFKSVDFTLISSFLSAMMNFGEQVIKCGLNVIDMGEYRFFVEQNKDISAYLITDRITSSLVIHERLEHLCEAFYEVVNVEKVLTSNQIYENPILAAKMDSISQFKDDYSEYKVDVIKNLFDQQILSNECAGGALLSMKGEIFYNSMGIEDLQAVLKEIEIRTRSETAILLENPKFISQTAKKIILAQCVKFRLFPTPVFVVLLFSGENASLGMADFALEDMVKKLDHALR